MSELYHTVHCKLCSKIFEAPPMKVPESVDEPPDQRTIVFVNNLAEHMAKKHPAEFNAIIVLSQGIIGTQVLRAFDIQDEGVLKRMENLRHQMFRLFQARTLLNDELQQLVNAIHTHELGIDCHEGTEVPYDVVMKICQGIRDYLAEREQPGETAVPATSIITQ